MHKTPLPCTLPLTIRMALCHTNDMELNGRQQAPAANVRTHLTEAEILELLELARQTDPRAWAIFALAFNHGLRVTEVLNLRLDGDINWKDRTIRIARLKGSMTTTQALVEMRGKPALSEISALRAYLKIRIEDGSGKLFTGQKGPLGRWTLTRMFRSSCEQVSQSRVRRGLQPIAANAMHFHSLKHSIATILASRVDNIFHVKTYLGHAAISSTMQYCHPNQKATGAKVKEILSQVFAN
jgi:type 1 fimbriae regulatory protein FimE